VSDVDAALRWYRCSLPDHPISQWLVYVMALVQSLSDRAVQEILERFPFAEADRSAITESRSAGSAIPRQLSRRFRRPSEVARVLGGLTNETLVLLWARSRPAIVKRQIAAYLMTYRTVKPVLTGKELHALGLSPGPLYGKILNRLLAARLDGEVRNEAEERDLVKRMVKNYRAVTV
jgi:tRNA nucleotidyltransferase (CCA-adding enzyme)